MDACKHCGACCDNPSRCAHCGFCRNCGKYIALPYFQPSPYIWPQPVVSWYPVQLFPVGPVWIGAQTFTSVSNSSGVSILSAYTASTVDANHLPPGTEMTLTVQ